jgi:uncharacterized membrane protein YdjX (TVP38/TMEM64 family)
VVDKVRSGGIVKSSDKEKPRVQAYSKEEARSMKTEKKVDDALPKKNRQIGQKMKDDFNRLKDPSYMKELGERLDPRKVDWKKRMEVTRRMIRVEKNLIIVIAILAILGLIAFSVGNSFTSPEAAANKFHSLGVWGPLIVILLVILEIVVAPVPGTLIYIAAGYAFGSVWGAVYVYIGAVIGAILAFYIARRYGRPFVEKIVPPDKLEPYDEFFRRRGILLLWIGFALPIFPSDIMSFVAGLSNVSLKKFSIIAAVASIPNVFLLTYVGSVLTKSSIEHVTLVVGAFLLGTFLVGSLLYFYLRKKMKGESVVG